MEWKDVISKTKAGNVSYSVPVVESFDDIQDNLVDLAGSEEGALDLVNAMLRRRAMTSGETPWHVGPSKGESGLSEAERKAKLAAARKAKTASQRGKDTLLKELLSGGITPDQLRERLSALGIKV